eukprot:128741-Lingulodinium_polyedra.AAC.1
MRQLRETEGYILPSWLLIDAESVFSAISASPIKTHSIAVAERVAGPWYHHPVRLVRYSRYDCGCFDQ